MPTTVNVEHIKSGKCTVTQIAEDILYVEVESNQEFTIDDYKDLMKVVKEIGNGKKYKILMHAGLHTLPTNEARMYITSSEGSKYKIADAFVVQSLAQNIIAKFIMKFQRPVVPTRVFKDDPEALLWLESIK